jgi:hypothetical protein
MSLTKQDLVEIRNVVLDALDVAVNPRLESIEKTLDEHTVTLAEHTATLAEHTAILNQHSTTLAKHTAILNQHSAVLNSQGGTLANHGVRLGHIEQKVDNVDGRLTAIEADVKELYGLYNRLNKRGMISDPRFSKLPHDQKLRTIQGEVLIMARALHVNLSSV